MTECARSRKQTLRLLPPSLKAYAVFSRADVRSGVYTPLTHPFPGIRSSSHPGSPGSPAGRRTKQPLLLPQETGLWTPVPGSR